MIELKPVFEEDKDYEDLERKIKLLFKRLIYLPLVKEFGVSSAILSNAKSQSLLDAIRFGRIQFYRGSFKGKFNASISKELKDLGAKWDRKTESFKLQQSQLPQDIVSAIQASETRFKQKIEALDKKIAQILPEEIADNLQVSNLFDSTLFKMDRDFQKTIKGITVAPKLTDDQRRRIADEWQNNLRVFIKDWTRKETVELREKIKSTVFAGNRYETVVKEIQKSYGVSANKAKFLARQETGLLVAKYKEVRYQDAGIKKFKWKCVSGTANHPVRDSHKICDNKIFYWDNPRELDKNGFVNPNGVHKPGENKNPKEDYNCRCVAIPIIEARVK